VLRSPSHHEKLSVISGVTADGELYFEIHEHDVSGTEVIWFLEQLLEEIPGRVLVLWDNGGIHRCVEVKTFVWENRTRLELRRFPPYAPELNPDEGIWDVIKNDRLPNYCPRTLEELHGTVAQELVRLKAHPRGSSDGHEPDRASLGVRQQDNPHQAGWNIIGSKLNSRACTWHSRGGQRVNGLGGPPGLRVTKGLDAGWCVTRELGETADVRVTP
jgi:transposase